MSRVRWVQVPYTLASLKGPILVLSGKELRVFNERFWGNAIGLGPIKAACTGLRGAYGPTRADGTVEIALRVQRCKDGWPYWEATTFGLEGGDGVGVKVDCSEIAPLPRGRKNRYVLLRKLGYNNWGDEVVPGEILMDDRNWEIETPEKIELDGHGKEAWVVQVVTRTGKNFEHYRVPMMLEEGMLWALCKWLPHPSFSITAKQEPSELVGVWKLSPGSVKIKARKRKVKNDMLEK